MKYIILTIALLVSFFANAQTNTNETYRFLTTGGTDMPTTQNIKNTLGVNFCIFDHVNGRVGVGRTPTASPLEIQGYGSDASTNAFSVFNSLGQRALSVRNDLRLEIRSMSSVLSAEALEIRPGNGASNSIAINPLSGYSGTSNFNTFTFEQSYTASSGSGRYNCFNVRPLINQTGTASGISCGIFVNPQVTLAASWRSFDTDVNTGFAYYQSGALAKNYYAGFLGLNETNPQQRLHINGNSQFDGAIMPSGNAGTSGQVLISSGSGVAPAWTTTTIKTAYTLDFPSTGVNANSDLTVSVTGAVIGDAVSIGIPTSAISNHSCYTAWVSSVNTVTIRFNHYGTAGPTDPTSGTFNIIVHKY